MLGNLPGIPPYPGRVCHCLCSQHPPSQDTLWAHRPVDPCASGSASSGHGPWREGVGAWGARVHTAPQRGPSGSPGARPPGAPSPGTSAPCSSPGQACSPAIPGPRDSPRDTRLSSQNQRRGARWGSREDRGGRAASRHRGAQMWFQRSWETGLLVLPGACLVGGQVEAAGGAGGAAGARRRRTCRPYPGGETGAGGAEQVCQRGAVSPRPGAGSQPADTCWAMEAPGRLEG